MFRAQSVAYGIRRTTIRRRGARARAGSHLQAALLFSTAVLLAGNSRAVSCTVTPNSMAFGNYDPSGAMGDQSTGNIVVSCQYMTLSITPVTVSLSSGASGTMAMRTMVNGSSALQYQLYSDAARSIVAGDGTGGSSTISASVVDVLGVALGPGSVTMNIYGQIPSGQKMVAPGSYLDTILVTVSY